MLRAALTLGVLSVLSIACAGARRVDCPATPLAQAAPPDANTARLTGTWYTNGALWAGPVPTYGGRWFAGPEGMKVGWWRTARGRLAITGRRLDAPAAPLRADVLAGYGDTGFQSTRLAFPAAGCWEVVARAGADPPLRLVVRVDPADANPLATPAAP
jgi:hypothetical protein